MKRSFSTTLLIVVLLPAAFLAGRWLPASPPRVVDAAHPPASGAAPRLDAAPALALEQPEMSAAAGSELYKVYSAFDFHPSRSDLEYRIDDGKLFSTTIQDRYGYWAALDLPNGAILSEVIFYLVDNDISANILFTVVENRPASNTMHFLLSAASNDLEPSPNIQSLSFPVAAVIDNREYTYYLKVEPTLAGSAHMLSGARVAYTLPTTYLPSVSR